MIRDHARHLQGRLGRQADRTGLAAGADRRTLVAAADHTVAGRIAGAVLAAGKGSGCGLHRIPGRTGPGERRSRAAARHTGHALEVGTGSAAEGRGCVPCCTDHAGADHTVAPKGTAAAVDCSRHSLAAAGVRRRSRGLGRHNSRYST